MADPQEHPPSITEYVTWDYEESAKPFYHIFSTDVEPGELEIGATLFRIVTRQSPEMDFKIAALSDAMRDVIADAVIALSAPAPHDDKPTFDRALAPSEYLPAREVIARSLEDECQSFGVDMYDAADDVIAELEKHGWEITSRALG